MRFNSKAYDELFPREAVKDEVKDDESMVTDTEDLHVENEGGSEGGDTGTD